MKSNLFLLLFTCNFIFQAATQITPKNDSSTYVSFKEKKVWYADLGFNTAPFSISFRDSLGNKERLFYRNNLRSVVGIGFSYKWFSLRLAINLPGHVKAVSKFGETTYFDFGFEFKTKKHFFDLDLHNYKGYAIKNAYLWNDSLNKGNNPHLISPELNALSLSINTWRFINKNIQINGLRGKTAHYTREEKSFYLKTTFNIHGISSNGPIIPVEKYNPKNSKTNASTFSAFDFGVLPGYVYVNRYKNFQYSAMFGLGPVVQIKNYYIEGVARSFVGLAPRLDIRLLAGYNVKKWFVNFVTEFDNKSIRFGNLAYRQTFYMVKLVAGIRLD